MKNILHLSASARAEDSDSYRLSQQIVAQLRKAHRDAQVRLA